jgi:hypothetical protein
MSTFEKMSCNKNKVGLDGSHWKSKSPKHVTLSLYTHTNTHTHFLSLMSIKRMSTVQIRNRHFLFSLFFIMMIIWYQLCQYYNRNMHWFLIITLHKSFSSKVTWGIKNPTLYVNRNFPVDWFESVLHRNQPYSIMVSINKMLVFNNNYWTTQLKCTLSYHSIEVITKDER